MSALSARRVAGFAAAALFLAVTIVLLLADRAVSILGPVDALIINIGQAIERTFDIDPVDRADIPGGPEKWGHVALWGSGMALFGWLLRRRVPLFFTALCVSGASLALELAQPILSSNRRFESADAVANMVGVALAAVLLIPLLWFDRRRRAEDEPF